MILFFDTETSGLPLWQNPSDDSRQPHLIQLAAMLCDDSGHQISTISTIVKPGDGAIMQPEALAAHGITLERATAEGLDPTLAVDVFLHVAGLAKMIVGHNVIFDERIMRIATARHRGIKWETPCQTFCTMKQASAIMNLPPTEKMTAAGFNKPKPPKLTECIRYFFDEDLPDAHDAMVDLQACKRVFFALKSAEAN